MLWVQRHALVLSEYWLALLLEVLERLHKVPVFVT